MPSAFGFAAFLSQDPRLKEAISQDLRQYLLQEGLGDQEIDIAQRAYDADPVAFSDPVPLHPNGRAQSNLTDFDALAFDDSNLTANSTDWPHAEPFYAPDYFQDMLNDPEYQIPTPISGSTPIASVNHQNILPWTHIPNPAETATSHVAPGPIRSNPKASQNTGQTVLNTSTGALISRKAKPDPTPRAIQKGTGRVIAASTLPFNQLAIHDHLQMNDELHVPLVAIVATDGSRQPVDNEVAVMVYKGRQSFTSSDWLVHCSALGGNHAWLTGTGPTDFAEKLNRLGMIGPIGRNWSGNVRVVKNGEDKGTVTEFKSACFS